MCYNITAAVHTAVQALPQPEIGQSSTTFKMDGKPFRLASIVLSSPISLHFISHTLFLSLVSTHTKFL